ncbi:MAG: Uma2 family endonuclease [Actinomycetota bacterium]|nr:Uma2 family endonuclease [Actinomycetota bacterium]
MTAMPEHHAESSAPLHLLTIEEYAALGETEHGYTELLEGRILMSPSPTRLHNRAIRRLTNLIESQLPDHLEVDFDLDVDLEFRPADEPGYCRRPDVIVYSRESGARVDAEGAILRASELALVIEVVSPGSKRTDRVTKHAEYADAGIPHYWIVDLSPPISLVACHLAGEFGYRNGDEITGTFTTTEPFPCTIDLDVLPTIQR